MTRIIHTALRYPPASGGAEVYIQNIVAKTRNIDEGRDVRVLSSAMRTHGPITMLEKDLLIDDPIYLQRLHVSATPRISYPRLQALSYYIGHHKPDILHSYGYWYQPADVTARYAKKHKIPFIFHPIYYKNRIRKKLVWNLYTSLIGKKTFAAADVVAVISRYEQKLIEDAGMPVKRFALIPPGIDVANFSVAHKNPFEARSIRGNILLAVSRISKAKGLQDIIRALPDIKRQAADTVLVIIGEDFGYKNTLVALAKKLGVQESVHFFGKASSEELYGAYQHATLFVHASHYEAFGIVLAEAMAAGLPVVARNAAAIPFVVPHEQAGLLFTTHDELVQNVVSLLGIPKLAGHLGSQGAVIAQQQYSWDASIKTLLSLYEELGR